MLRTSQAAFTGVTVFAQITMRDVVIVYKALTTQHGLGPHDRRFYGAQGNHHGHHVDASLPNSKGLYDEVG